MAAGARGITCVRQRRWSQLDTIELRIEMTEELVRELLWQALAPDAIVMTGTLGDAIAQQQAIRGVSLDGYQLAGISVTVEEGRMYAELAYMPMQRDANSHA
jgi:hypothetical protein